MGPGSFSKEKALGHEGMKSGGLVLCEGWCVFIDLKKVFSSWSFCSAVGIIVLLKELHYFLNVGEHSNLDFSGDGEIKIHAEVVVDSSTGNLHFA